MRIGELIVYFAAFSHSFARIRFQHIVRTLRSRCFTAIVKNVAGQNFSGVQIFYTWLKNFDPREIRSGGQYFSEVKIFYNTGIY